MADQLSAIFICMLKPSGGLALENQEHGNTRDIN
jgi:hypothetical protein